MFETKINEHLFRNAQSCTQLTTTPQENMYRIYLAPFAPCNYSTFIDMTCSPFLLPSTLASDKVGLHIIGARHEEAVDWKGDRFAPVHRVLGPEPLGLRTHSLRDRSLPNLW